jgi:predicted metal-dependent enzyme (double-stranded beta helix superfamily)
VRTVWEWLLDEKVVFSVLAVLFSAGILVCIHWKAEREIVAMFYGLASACVGALTRGITHQPQSSDSTQNVTSTTTISPKPNGEVKP